jgi:ATP-dependent DNA helicase RecQ
VTHLSDLLREVFGFDAFRPGQHDIVDHVTAGGDALVLMPTGSGKSLCYQLPALARERAGLGVTVVVSPLIALMHDQVGALLEAGVAAAVLNSSLTPAEASAVEQRFLHGDISLLYAAPERITTPRFMALLDALAQRQQLALFAIDEAHCVSQWGHDFRPEYRSLSILHERFPGIPRVALTATADELTRRDIIERLQLESARCFISSFDRPNIRYTIVNKDNPTAQLIQFLRSDHAGDAGVVYCQSRKRVEEVAHMLSQAGIPALPYHAGMDGPVRQAHQDRFLREDGLVMVATVAFGMGIDKPDVRFVAHLDMPKNIEAYYQETGRAGRDSLPAHAWMTYGLQDVVNQRRMIDESPAPDAFKQILRGKLDALLALAETAECRRVRLLGYFGEASQACGNCDNCLSPPHWLDASDTARKLLSCVYRVQQHSGMAFGVGHLLDIVLGRSTDKVTQHGHTSLSTWSVCAGTPERELKSVLRQLVATGALHVDTSGYNTLSLTALARPILKGDTAVQVRKPTEARTSTTRRMDGRRSASGAVARLLPDMDEQALARFASLKAWRAQVAREHNRPAYVIFHDATLADIAQRAPLTLDDLRAVSGLGEHKLAAYGDAVLAVVSGGADPGLSA